MQRLRKRFQRSSLAAASPTVEEVEGQGPLGMHILRDKKSRSDGIIDIVAIHGLNGDPIKTWTADFKGTSVNWLKDMLHTAISNARIMSYGYDSSVQFSKATADIGTFAEGLLAELMSLRMTEQEKRRPIIFICHSLGGIVFKQALVKARERDRFTELLVKIRGVAFFGTPHAGSSLASFGDALASIIQVSTLGANTNAKLVADLKNNSETLWRIARSFVDRGKTLRIVSFYETKKMPYMNKLVIPKLISKCVEVIATDNEKVVEENSAILNLPNEVPVPLDGDHTSICRFHNGREDESRYRIVWSQLKEMVDVISQSEVAYFTKLSEHDQRRCLQSFYFQNYEGFRDRNPDRVTGTCEWFLQHSEYQNWRTQARSSLLWVSADPGYGKSVLAKFLVDLLRQLKPKDGRPELVCHFFFKGDNDDQRNITLALRALLHQIFADDSRLLRHAFSQFESKDIAIVENLDILWGIFLQILSDKEATNLVFILDGLDELDLESQRDLLGRMNKLYNNKDLSSPPFVKTIILSRPENLIKSYLISNRSTVRLRGENETEAISKDVACVVQSHMSGLREQGLPQTLLAELQRVLIHKADRTFLWTTLMINLLEDAAMNGASENELKALLSYRDIDNLYSKFLCRSARQDRTKELLQLVLGARQPLSLMELNIALVISPRQLSFGSMRAELKTPMENYIKATCGHFIRIIHDRVYFVHETAREFLIRQPDDLQASHLGPWYRSLNLVDCDDALLRSCVCFILLYAVAEDAPDGITISETVFPYAFNWPLHCRSDNHAGFQVIVDVFLHLRDRWLEYLETEQIWELGTRTEGESQRAEKIWNQERGSMAELNRPAEVRYCFPNTYRWSGVQNSILQLDNWRFAVPNEECDWDASGGRRNFVLESAIQKVLFEDEFCLQAHNCEERTLLHYAAATGSFSLVKVLVRERVDLLAVDRYNNSPLHLAVYFDSSEDKAGVYQSHTVVYSRPLSETWHIMKYLLAEGAHIDEGGCNGQTPLMRATQHSHRLLVELLCSHGAKVNAADNDGMTALCFAIKRGSLQLVEYLIGCGAEVNYTCNDGSTPIFLASQTHAPEIVEILIAKGAESCIEKENPLPPNCDEKSHSLIVSSLRKDPRMSQLDCLYSTSHIPKGYLAEKLEC